MNKVYRFFTSAILASFLSILAITPALAADDPNTKDKDIVVDVLPSLSFGLSGDSISLDISPDAAGKLTTGTVSANAYVNNPTGYKLYMNTSGDTADLTQTGVLDKIPTLTSDATNITTSNQSSFTMNSWGYALGNLSDSPITFKAVPTTTTTPIKSVDQASGDSIPVTFGVRSDMNLPSGSYTNTVVFSLIPNYVPNDTTMVFGGITNMQDMTGAICDAETTPTKEATSSTFLHTTDTSKVPTTILTDTRDGERYMVRKLADGNCWMSQNLRLKLTANTPLTSADTDVSSNFTPTISTQATSENTTSWGVNNNASDVNKSRSYDTGNKDYGTYYNWYTATAGTGTYDMTSGNATGSICPKNWQLPLNDGTKSYSNLITTAYGLASNAEGFTKLQSAPLSFPLSGYYGYSGSVSAQGSGGDFWSATPLSSANRAYFLYFVSSAIYPQGLDDKASGFPVRCVARDDIVPPENTSALTQALKDANANFEQAADGKNYYTMQSMTSSICGAVSTPAKTVTSVPEATLIDTRDNELYTVRKLADGNCWMSQNLRLKLTANTPLTSADTDVTSNFTPTLSTQPTSENTTSWGSYNTASDVNKSRSYDTGNRDYGTYYNWYTATAGTGLYDNTTTNATSSICPKNWQLPLNDSTKSYVNLITTTYGLASSAEGSTKLQSTPLSFPLSGFYSYSGSVYNQGSDGYFWSATPYSSALNAYYLYFNSSYIYPQNYNYKARGNSVRCVVR